MITNTGLNQLKEIIDYMDKVPYCVTPKTLYCPKQLYDGFDPCREQTYKTCYDGIVYHNYKASGVQNAPAYELLARGLHDNRMLAALNQFLDSHGRNATIGVMGGHALARTDATYRQIALLGKRLTEQGFVMLSGGGPGAMEATHLGAWMAGRSNQQLDQAIEMLSPSPTFNDEGWLSTAFDVISTFRPPHRLPHTLPNSLTTACAKTASSPSPTAGSSMPPAAPAPCRRSSRKPSRTTTSRWALPAP